MNTPPTHTHTHTHTSPASMSKFHPGEKNIETYICFNALFYLYEKGETKMITSFSIRRVGRLASLCI